MDTNRIKRFATEARNILKAGIAAKITTLGFDKNGNVAEANKPQLMQGGSLWNEQLQTEGFYYQWMSLYNRIQQKGISEVYEEAAYTWFNRLCAIRILQKNNLCSPVLAYADAARTPVIVDEARQGRIPQMKEELRQRLVELLDDDTKVTEQFAILITAWCHDKPIINQCFGSIADYTELLLPNNILAEGGFVDMLNHTEFITDEDFQSPELIGWLYQFYISERKDEVFAKKGKFEADEIPAATQIFTPNWIVKYMVQNTVGRIYLDNNPYETQLQKKWQYLVESSEKPSEDTILKYNELEDLKVADLACGSGHILNECFDLLYDLYIAEGYGRGEAVENIFSHNLTGIDLDTRAKQLATFALLLKACQKDATFVDAHCMPNVLTMPKPWNRETQGSIQKMLHIYFRGEATNQQENEIMDCFDLMQNADSLGSIMKFDISESTRLLIKQTTDYWCSQEIVPEEERTQIPAFKMILALTEKYHALVMNPPYMGSSHMNDILKTYLERHYQEGKNDLMTAFMIKSMNSLLSNGYWGMINLPSWMFISSYEDLRKTIINKQYIFSLMNLGRGIFGSDFGSVVFVIQNCKQNINGHYRKLYKKHVQVRSVEKIRELFFDNNYGFYVTNQQNFLGIPGCSFGFWASKKTIDLYNGKQIKNIATFKRGLGTGDNNRFIRLWHEISYRKFSFSNDVTEKRKKWQKFNKGGDFHKWYGNREYVINWENEGYEIRNFYLPSGKLASRPQNLQYNYQKNISYSSLTIGKPSFRSYFDFLNDQAGNYFILKNDSDYNQLLALFNSCILEYFKELKNITVNITADDISTIPFVVGNNIKINELVDVNLDISRSDWDAHETSWDFQRNELLSIDTSTYMENLDYKIEKYFEETGEHIDISPAAPQLGSLEWRMEQYKTKWERKFMQLHKNEEELNRQFIDIYGLQDELTPDVPLNEITILQQGEISIE